MPSTISSEPFIALVADLKKSGYTVHSARLESVLNGVWTTSSEQIGELGRVVVTIRKECCPLTKNQKTLIKECLRQVRKAWPGFGLFNFFPPWSSAISMAYDCDYCRQWNQEHPVDERRVSCGPCAVCQASGHLKSHPRQPTSICLCQQHWDELNGRGYRFELYHLIYVIIFGIAAVQIYSLIARLWGG